MRNDNQKLKFKDLPFVGDINMIPLSDESINHALLSLYGIAPEGAASCVRSKNWFLVPSSVKTEQKALGSINYGQFTLTTYPQTTNWLVEMAEITEATKAVRYMAALEEEANQIALLNANRVCDLPLSRWADGSVGYHSTVEYTGGWDAENECEEYEYVTYNYYIFEDWTARVDKVIEERVVESTHYKAGEWKFDSIHPSYGGYGGHKVFRHVG